MLAFWPVSPYIVSSFPVRFQPSQLKRLRRSGTFIRDRLIQRFLRECLWRLECTETGHNLQDSSKFDIYPNIVSILTIALRNIIFFSLHLSVSLFWKLFSWLQLKLRSYTLTEFPYSFTSVIFIAFFRCLYLRFWRNVVNKVPFRYLNSHLKIIRPDFFNTFPNFLVCLEVTVELATGATIIITNHASHDGVFIEAWETKMIWFYTWRVTSPQKNTSVWQNRSLSLLSRTWIKTDKRFVPRFKNIKKIYIYTKKNKNRKPRMPVKLETFEYWLPQVRKFHCRTL